MHVSEYLADSPGFQVWTGGGWAAFSGTNAATLAFSDDASPDVGELSVRHYAAAGVWLMMYQASHSSTVVMRWAPAPTGPWSTANVIVDMSSTAARSTYCCQGSSLGMTPGGPDWACSGQQIVECGSSTGDPTGAPRAGLYAPSLLPYLVPSGGGFIAYFLLSSFVPYNTELMSFSIHVTH
jgi:hypothetical protein